MAVGFIIMQIGDVALDEVCAQAIVPAIVAAGLDAKRVDKHNSGGLLKTEIVRFIEEADIIVADLTNERPNCYLEVGYAMGLDKFRNLVLTAREDHNPGSPSHVVGGPKIHFDLSGYEVLFWNPSDIPGFRTELEKRIRRRQAILPKPTAGDPFDEEWTARQRAAAVAGLERMEFKAFMEVRFAAVQAELNVGPAALLSAAQKAEIHAFGWPIGIVLNPTEFAPKPRADGITAEISTTAMRHSYDYWALRRNGDFYLLHSLFEDGRAPTPPVLFFDTRVVRITEVLLYCRRLYERLDLAPSDRVSLEITHAGLAGRSLRSASGRHLSLDRTTVEDRVSTRATVSLDQIESRLPQLVAEFTAPLFEVFEFFKLSDSVLADLVDSFVSEVNRRG